MKVWITKYALTKGITLVNAEICQSAVGMICYREKAGDLEQYAHGEGKDWHITPESAQARAEVMRQTKIASLKKSLAKLERMTFKVPND